MGSKTFLLFGVLVAVLLVTSHVAARELAETSTQNNHGAEGEVAKHPDYRGGGGGGGCCGGGSHGGGNSGHHGGGGGGYCRYGCCYKGYYGGCSRCCAYAGEAVQTEPKPETKPLP